MTGPLVKVGGVDPGPRPGLVILHVQDGHLLRVERGEHLSHASVVEESDYVAVERYVRGARSSRMRDTAAQLTTELMARETTELCSLLGRTFQALPAGAVKPWADDERLRSYHHQGPGEGWGQTLYALTAGGGGHDRDAARHALNLAVKLRLLPAR